MKNLTCASTAQINRLGPRDADQTPRHCSGYSDTDEATVQLTWYDAGEATALRFARLFTTRWPARSGADENRRRQGPRGPVVDA
jgi:hypothetical protein